MPHGNPSGVTGRNFAVPEYAQYLNSLSDRRYNALRDNYNSRSARRSIESFEDSLRSFDHELRQYLRMNRAAGFRSAPGPSLIADLLETGLGRDGRGEPAPGVEQQWRQRSERAGFRPLGGQGGSGHHGRSYGPPSHHGGHGLGGGGGPSGYGHGGYHGGSFGSNYGGGYGGGVPPPYGYGPRSGSANRMGPNPFAPSPPGHGFGGGSGRPTPRLPPDPQSGRMGPAAGYQGGALHMGGHGGRSHAGGSSHRSARPPRAAAPAYPDEAFEEDE